MVHVTNFSDLIALLATIALDVSDRPGRLLGILYGNLAQIQQIADLTADGLTPTNVLSAGTFPHVYDPVAGDWNRWIQGLTQGVPLVEELSPTVIIEGQFTLNGAAQQLPDEPCKSVTLENPSTNAVVVIGHDNALTLLNGYRLWPGATKSQDVDNVNAIWVIGTAPQVISYGGVN